MYQFQMIRLEASPEGLCAKLKVVLRSLAQAGNKVIRIEQIFNPGRHGWHGRAKLGGHFEVYVTHRASADAADRG